MLTGRRFRVELTDAQARLAEETADACRAVYNTGLEQRREYRRRGAWINYEQQAHELVEAKAEHTWLSAALSHCLQQALRDLDEACRRHGTFNVRWRSARRRTPSFRFPDGSRMKLQKLNRRRSQVKLPKLGWVKFRASRSLEGETIRSATLTQEGQHWFVSLLVEDGKTTPAEHSSPGTAVGVDFWAKTARKLARENALVALEKLPVRTMTRRARPVPDPAKPGQYLSNGGSAKSGLNRAILSKGWHGFEVALKSASRDSGTQVVKVPAALTSQRCSACGHVDPKSRESQAVFRCTHCSRPPEHADVNAAKNILAAGLLAVSACGDDP